ncbi:MAG: hypothetical protein R2909_00300 [Gemmatimonadales bacterium]
MPPRMARVGLAMAGLLLACAEPPATERSGPLLPAPDGPETIGSAIFEWVDSSRAEPATEDTADRRLLRAQLWYPADRSAGGDYTPLFPELAAYRAADPEAFPPSLAQLGTHSLADAAIRSDGGPFPVVLFFHGWNSQRSAYTGLLETLASHGFVAVGLDQPFAGRIVMPDGTVTPSRDDQFGSAEAMLAAYSADGLFALDRLRALDAAGRFRGRLDLSRVATVGHSNGAVSAVVLAQRDERIVAVALLDSFGQDVEPIFRVSQPLLLLRTGGASAPSAGYLDGTGNELFDVTIPGGAHLTASDWPWIRAPDDSSRAAALAPSLALRRTLVAFLDRALKGNATQVPQQSDLASGAARLETHRP